MQSPLPEKQLDWAVAVLLNHCLPVEIQFTGSPIHLTSPTKKRFFPYWRKMLCNSHISHHSRFCEQMGNNWIYLKSNPGAAQNSSHVWVIIQWYGEKRYSWMVLAADKTIIQCCDKNIITYYYCLKIAFTCRQFMFYLNNMLWINKIKYILKQLVWLWGNYSQELSDILSQTFCCYFLPVLSGLHVVTRNSKIHYY